MEDIIQTQIKGYQEEIAELKELEEWYKHYNSPIQYDIMRERILVETLLNDLKNKTICHFQ